MNKEEIRQEYKNLQHVEHDFRDLKSELEKHIYPFLQEINKNRKTRLSFNDMIAELKY